MRVAKQPLKFNILLYLAIVIIAYIPGNISAQDTSSSLLNINKLKIVQKAKNLVDSANSKINKKFYDRINDSLKSLSKKGDTKINNLNPKEELDERPLPAEILLNKKYNLGRRAYQNTVAQFNYLFNGEEELKEIIQRARSQFKDDYNSILSFYDYDLATTSKSSMDSIIYRCNANIVLHDLRNNWVDDSYFLLAKAYFFHRNFDTAASVLQFINYSFDEKSNGMDLPMGSNLRNGTGTFSLSNQDDNSFFKSRNIRNESMIWQARNYIESNKINEALSLLQLLKADGSFPKRLYPFLNEQFAYAYYNMESYELAAKYLIEALPNAIDNDAKSRWYFLIAQMWQKVNNSENAYIWYKKATQISTNPIIGVYAAINMIRIETEKSNKNWLVLANELEKITKKEKYKPYTDIIYFELAKIAIQNKGYVKANEWLIRSIKNNYDNPKQKENAFELLGEINYDANKFLLSKMAYDSLNNTLKTNPQFEQIALRKKWLGTIIEQLNIIETEDTLQMIYQLPVSQQTAVAKSWKKRFNEKSKFFSTIFSDQSKQMSSYLQPTQNSTNVTTVNNSSNQFYFENPYAITQGKQSFVQKWGERPNVDNWRRKTSSTMANRNASNINNEEAIKINAITKEDKKDSNSVQLISTDQENLASKIKWNKAALTAAETFLIKLNDFEKAKLIYKQIIERNIDATTTERAFLDLASQYIHIGEREKADEIIKILTSRFPNGIYMNKKIAADAKLSKSGNIDKLYNEAYFLCQIGNWTELESMANKNNAAFLTSKWHTPLQFLKVKMYAQQKNDQRAFEVIDSIIQMSNNEIYRERAASLKIDLKNRNNTESYLSKLSLDSVKSYNGTDINSAINLADNTPKKSENNSSENEKVKTDAFKNKELPPNPNKFSQDSAEVHYIGLVAINTNSFMVTKIKDSLFNTFNIDFAKQKIGSSISQLEDKFYIIWMGPFSDFTQSKKYLNIITPTLKKGLANYLTIDKYDFITINKSNIVKLNSYDTYKAYKLFLTNYIY